MKNVAEFKEQIVDLIRNNQITIIVSETGSGKSTILPQILMEEFKEKIFVTQPRAMAAINLAEYVSQQIGENKVGGKVGFCTKDLKSFSYDTVLSYVTDGTVLAKSPSYLKEGNILVIDEVHEFNLNVEALLALIKSEYKKIPNFKVVIMSATLDGDSLAKYFDDAPVFRMETGTPYEITTEKYKANTETKVILSNYKEGKSVLVFLPGKKEISVLYSELRSKLGDNAKIYSLHGEMLYTEQMQAFLPGQKIILSTNIAQTSLTIPDIDVVVDLGKARTKQINDTVEGLYIVDISQADCIQRMGRVGRTKPGKYILCSDVPFQERPKFSKPEIQAAPLESIVLKLLAIGIDAEKLNFFHQPEINSLRLAKQLLRMLEAIDENDSLTDIGEEMVWFPLGPRGGRMYLEALKYNVTGDICILIALIENYGIRRKNKNATVLKEDSTISDLINEMMLFKRCYSLYKNRKKMDSKKINVKMFKKALSSVKIMYERFYIESTLETMEFDSEALIKCLIVGNRDRIFWKVADHYTNGCDTYRILDKKSVCNFSNNQFVMGLPLDLQIQEKNAEKRILPLLVMCTALSKELLKNLDEVSIENKICSDGLVEQWFLDKRIIYRNVLKTPKKLLEKNPELFQVKYEFKNNTLYETKLLDNVECFNETYKIEEFYFKANLEEWLEMIKQLGIEEREIDFFGKKKLAFFYNNNNIFDIYL